MDTATEHSCGLKDGKIIGRITDQTDPPFMKWTRKKSTVLDKLWNIITYKFFISMLQKINKIGTKMVMNAQNRKL